MDMKSVFSCVLVLSLQFVCGQYSNTPCPGIFDFVNDGQQVYGKITLRPTAPVSSLVLRINFTIAAKVYNMSEKIIPTSNLTAATGVTSEPVENYPGQLEALDSQRLLQKYNAGQAVTYLVHFPISSPLPKLTSITANSDTVCYGPGDIPVPNSYVTTLSLQHTSFIEGGGSPAYNNFQHQPHSRPQNIRPQHQPQRQPVNHVHYDDDGTAIYTFSNNIEPTWNTGNTQYTQPTQQYQPPTQQIFQSRPTYEYDEPHAQIPIRPVRPNTAVQIEPTRPVYEAAPPTRPSQNDFYNSDQQTSVTASPNRLANTPEPPIECGVIYGGNNIALIYNGDAYERGELPWLVAIYKHDQASLRFICGGTLVSNRHVITAAHCMHRRNTLTSTTDIVVKLGVHNLNNWTDDTTITSNLLDAHFHKEYNSFLLRNDIMILTLQRHVKFNDIIRPACLWAGNTDLSLVVGRSGTVAGWGEQGVGGFGKQGEPHKVDIPIVSTNDCRASKSQFHELTYENTLCAGDRMGSGPCVGDSGGGLYLIEGGKWRVRGVVSVSLRPESGDASCNLNEYVVFTDTAQFLPWINEIIAMNNN